MNAYFALIVFIGYLVICNNVGRILPREMGKKERFVYPSSSDSIGATQKNANKQKNKTMANSKIEKRNGQYIWDNSTCIYSLYPSM